MKPTKILDRNTVDMRYAFARHLMPREAHRFKAAERPCPFAMGHVLDNARLWTHC